MRRTMAAGDGSVRIGSCAQSNKPSIGVKQILKMVKI